MSLRLKPTKEPGIYRRDGETGTTFVVVTDADPDERGRRQQIKRSFKTFEMAKDYKTKVAHERSTGSYVEPSRQLLKDYLDTWCDAQRGRIRPSAILAYRQAMARWQSLHNVPLAKLTPDLIHRAEQKMLDIRFVRCIIVIAGTGRPRRTT